MRHGGIAVWLCEMVRCWHRQEVANKNAQGGDGVPSARPSFNVEQVDAIGGA
jgi:hypothetical protein